MTLSPVPFGTVLDSPVIMDSSTSAAPSTTVPSAGTRAPGRTRTTSPTRNSESETDWVSAPAYAFSGVREQGGKCIERTASLGNCPHFQPVAEDHDRDQRRKFPPNVNFKEAECRSERRSKSDNDRQADQRHHARLVIGKFASCSADENKAAISRRRRFRGWRG